MHSNKICAENATKNTPNTPQQNLTNLPNQPKDLGYAGKKNLTERPYSLLAANVLRPWDKIYR